MESGFTRLLRFPDATHITDTVDLIGVHSQYPAIETEITIVLKKAANSSTMCYFIRYNDVASTQAAEPQIAVVIKETNEVLIGEESLEELLSISMNLVHKTSWSYRGHRIWVDGMVFSVGYLDHGAVTSNKLAVIEIMDTLHTKLSDAQAVSTLLDSSIQKYLGKSIMGHSNEDVTIKHDGQFKESSQYTCAHVRALLWIKTLALLT
jgi:hypothetical protein